MRNVSPLGNPAIPSVLPIPQAVLAAVGGLEIRVSLNNAGKLKMRRPAGILKQGIVFLRKYRVEQAELDKKDK